MNFVDHESRRPLICGPRTFSTGRKIFRSSSRMGFMCDLSVEFFGTTKKCFEDWKVFAVHEFRRKTFREGMEVGYPIILYLYLFICLFVYL